jgi:hypothetical protein
MARDLAIGITVESAQAEAALARVDESLKQVAGSGLKAGDSWTEMERKIDKSVSATEKKFEDQAKATEKVNEKLTAQRSIMGDLERTVLRYAGPAAIGMAIKSTLAFADNVETLAKQSRMSTDAVQTLGFVASRNGSSFQAVANAVNNLDKALETNNKTTQRILKELGFSVEDLLRLRPEDRFRELGIAIGGLEDDSRRSEAAMRLFGASGKDLLATFHDLAAGAEKDAPRMSSAWVESMAEVDRAWKDVKQTGMDVIRTFFGIGPMIRKAMMDAQALGVDMQNGMPANLPGVPTRPSGWGPEQLPMMGVPERPSFNGVGLDYWERQMRERGRQRTSNVLPFERPGYQPMDSDYLGWLQQGRGPVGGFGGGFPGWAQPTPFSGQFEGGLPMVSYASMTASQNRPGAFGGFMSGAGGRFLSSGLGMASSFIPGMSGMGSSIGGMFGGAAGGLKSITGLLGSFAPFLGPIAGIAGGLIGKLFGGEGRQVKKDRSSFISDFGGMDALQKAADTAGFSLDKLLSTKKTKEFESEIKKLEKAMGDFDAKVNEANTELGQMESTLASTVRAGEELGYTFDENGELVSVSFKKMQEAAAKYGMDLNTLGPAFQQQRLHEMAGEIINDFTLLSKGGTDTGTILAGMAPQINAVVNESMQFGTTIPENMKPWIENLMAANKLTDANGVAITDLSAIKFGEPIASEFSMIQDSLKELIDKIGELVDRIADMGTTVDSATRDRTIRIGFHVDEVPDLSGESYGMSRGGFVPNPKYLSGGGFIPRGTDTVPAMLTPGEGVLRRESVSRLMRGDWPQGGGSVNITIDNIDAGGYKNDQQAELALGKALVRGLKRRGVRLNAA